MPTYCNARPPKLSFRNAPLANLLHTTFNHGQYALINFITSTPYRNRLSPRHVSDLAALPPSEVLSAAGAAWMRRLARPLPAGGDPSLTPDRAAVSVPGRRRIVAGLVAQWGAGAVAVLVTGARRFCRGAPCLLQKRRPLPRDARSVRHERTGLACRATVGQTGQSRCTPADIEK